MDQADSRYSSQTSSNSSKKKRKRRKSRKREWTFWEEKLKQNLLSIQNFRDCMAELSESTLLKKAQLTEPQAEIPDLPTIWTHTNDPNSESEQIEEKPIIEFAAKADGQIVNLDLENNQKCEFCRQKRRNIDTRSVCCLFAICKPDFF